jgi:hypothetical protein
VTENTNGATAPDRGRPLGRILGLIDKYLVMTEQQKLVVSLWIVHAHLVGELEQTVYLTVTSPQKQCGKSRLLELLELLVPRPWMTVMPSEAVVYRQVHSKMPTLLLDEVDAIFAPKTADRHEGLRAVLNAGHRRSATVPRCVNFTEVENFRVYCAKVLAGIGVLPDTIADRSLPIRLQRKTKDERVSRFYRRTAESECEPIREAIADWAGKNGAAIAEARPEMPDELSDRMQEGCEPLVAIADALGYGKEARDALVDLLTSGREDSKESAELRLLSDIRDIFEARGTTVIGSAQLVQALITNGNGWMDWYGRGLSTNDIATLVKPYGIRSKTVRLAEGTAKGYSRDDFAEAWARYLPAKEAEEAQ